MSRLLLLLCLLALPALAQQAPADGSEPVAALQSAFEFGNYADVLKRAQARIDQGGLAEDQLVQLHRLAGLSAFNLQSLPEAERHFTALLELSPDYQLDPFAVPPPAMQFFDQVRKKLGPRLDQARAAIKVRQERARQDAEARTRAEAEAQAERHRLEEAARRVTVRTVEKRSFWVNFVPFGAGQFQQGRDQVAVSLAVTEGVLAATSIISYFAYDSLFETRTVPGAPGVTETGIPQSRQIEARNWRYLKIGASLGFYLVWAGGVADAIYHHQDEVVTTTTEQAPASEPLPPTRPTADARAGLIFVPHGAGAGLTVHF